MGRISRASLWFYIQCEMRIEAIRHFSLKIPTKGKSFKHFANTRGLLGGVRDCAEGIIFSLPQRGPCDQTKRKQCQSSFLPSAQEWISLPALLGCFHWDSEEHGSPGWGKAVGSQETAARLREKIKSWGLL